MGFYFYSFTCFFFPQLPTLFPPGKGPFASLARVSFLHHFYFRLIDMSFFKDRGVAMGKPHCNSSICNFRSCTYRMSATVAHASGSERWVMFPGLIFRFCFLPCNSVLIRGKCLFLITVADASGRLWQICFRGKSSAWDFCSPISPKPSQISLFIVRIILSLFIFTKEEAHVIAWLHWWIIFLLWDHACKFLVLNRWLVRQIMAGLVSAFSKWLMVKIPER